MTKFSVLAVAAAIGTANVSAAADQPVLRSAATPTSVVPGAMTTSDGNIKEYFRQSKMRYDAFGIHL